LSAREMGDGLGTALTQSNLAELYADQNKTDEAEQAYQVAIESFRHVKHESATTYNLAGLAQVQLAQAHSLSTTELKSAHIEQAERNAREALEIADRIQSPERQGVAHRVIAEVALAQGDSVSAERHVQLAMELLEQASAQTELERAGQTRARIKSAVSA